MPTKAAVTIFIGYPYLIRDNNATGRTLASNNHQVRFREAVHLHILNNSFSTLAERQIGGNRMHDPRASRILTRRFTSAATDLVKTVGRFAYFLRGAEHTTKQARK